MHRDAGEATAEAVGPAVGRQIYRATIGQQSRGERFGREQMPTGAAGREDERVHSSLPLNLRRVNASIIPMPSDSASIDEPP